MHFDFSISLGTILVLIGIGGTMFRIEHLASKFMIEHEILVHDYCERHGLSLKDLPTRSR